MKTIFASCFVLLSLLGNAQYFSAGIFSNTLFGSDDNRRLEGYGISQELFYQGRTNERIGFSVGLNHGYFHYDSHDYYSFGFKKTMYYGYGLGIRAGVPIKLPVDSVKKVSFYFTPYLKFSVTEKMPKDLWVSHRYVSFDAGVSLSMMYTKYNHCFYFGILANLITMHNDFGNGLGLWFGYGIKSFKKAPRPPKKNSRLF